MKQYRQSFWLIGSLSLFCLATTSPLPAQVVQDATLPHPSAVTLNGSTSVITGGTKAGTNLFHSFREFSLPEGTASFQGVEVGIKNVISRVTGTSVSNINGRIEVLQTNGIVSPANFFLLNPNGIVFGPNASLNIGGSFLASTASSLNFADGSQFSVDRTQNTAPLLTISVPIGLQFGANPGNIGNQSVAVNRRYEVVGLEVLPGRTLALVGGNVTLEGGYLIAPGGRIELGSIAGLGFVSLNPTGLGWSLGYEKVQKFQDIQLSHTAEVMTSGEGGGDIQVYGRRVTLTDDSQIVARNRGTSLGGTLAVTASESVELRGNSTGIFPSGLFTQVNPNATGNGGDLTITTQKLIVRDGAQVNTTTSGRGKAGNLTVRSSEIELDGVARDAASQPIANGGLLYSSGLFAGVEMNSQGAGGDLTVETNRLVVQNGAVVQTSTFGQGNAGNLTIKANDLVTLSGTVSSSRLRVPSSLLAVSGGISGFPGVIEATGKGGNINLELHQGQLLITDGAVVAVSSLNPSQNVLGAGNIIITSPIIRLEKQGTITAETVSGDGGNITLRSQNIILLRDHSQISTSAGTVGAGGSGGNITINRPFLVSPLLENNDITANAFSGKGGSIIIDARGIFGLKSESRQDLEQLLRTTDSTQLDPSRLQTNDITAISQENPNFNGEVIINTPNVNPSQGLVALPTRVVYTSGLIASGCATFAGKQASTFVVTGRSGLPSTPYEEFTSDAIWEDARLPTFSKQKQFVNATHSSIRHATPIMPAQGWILNQRGEVVLIAKEPNLPTHSIGSTPTICDK
ncbi:MAG: filamentous hemagglutinin N-terminal domain-containing protein [Rhizonema sp. NSF051]|nr:filamentous hemagglutinin N-terminal domain-containing protein [Rhizonema sp. NSF051]